MNDTSGSADHRGKSQLENTGEEQYAEDDERKPPAMAKKTWGEVIKELKTFLWNPEKRECMGRTPHSWGLIILFYLVFYLFLAGMFAFCLYVLLLTLSPYTPKYRDRVSPPGVMIRPHVNHGFIITFTVSDPKSWEPFVKNLEQFLEAYNDSVQESRNAVCTPGSYFIQDIGESTMKRACQFKRSMLKNCSGLDDETFGYSRGQPCILLKMNRIIGYRPGYGTPVTVECKGQVPLDENFVLLLQTNMATDLNLQLSQSTYSDPSMELSRQKDDESYIQAMDFYPSTTFDPMYFPYYGKLTHENYTSPLVAIQFTLRNSNTTQIQCQLNGVGIINNMQNDRFLGRINFMLTIKQ